MAPIGDTPPVVTCKVRSGERVRTPERNISDQLNLPVRMEP
jgi:hypothetical protein